MDKLKKIIKLLFGYGGSQFLVILLPIILLPILTRSLTVVEFADFSIYKVISGLSTPIIAFALSTFLLKNFYSSLKNTVNGFIFNSSIFSILVTAVLIIITLFLSDALKALLELNDHHVIVYAFINTCLFSIHTLLLTYYRAESNMKKFFMSNLSVFFITIGGVLFISNTNYMSLELVLNIHMIGYLSSILMGFIFFIKFNSKDFSLNKPLLKKAVSFSIPLVLYSIFTQIYTGTDKLIINSMLTKIDLASYSAIFQLSFGVSAAGNVLQLAFSPYLFKKMSSNKTIDKEIVKTILSITFGMIIFSMIYYLLFPFLIEVFLPVEYFINIEIAKWFIIAGFMQVQYWIINPFLIIYEKNSYLLYIAIIAALVNIILNLIFTKNGVEYAAMIYCITWVIQYLGTLIAIYYAKKNFKTF